ncbi:MAG: type III-A CRISPR-associated RAMP protein Csm5 [Methyloprofundus sp.]|nr:type III-A CRISPR-associated RAMP protein Csm5 [Methyloprofundus sp.]
MNKAFLNTTRCTISTLSPVHIGCGEDYYPTNYVIDGGLLHHFSEEGLLLALTLPEKNALAKIAEEQGDNGIKKLQTFIHSKRDKLQLQATHSVPLSEALEKFYRSRIGQTTQRESNGRTGNIARHAFNPYKQTPYFAGSSIKGAIRTALLNALNDGDPLPGRVDADHDVPRGEGDKLQKRLLAYKAIPDDPLRLLKISDAAYSHPDNLNAAEIRFAVNRKNKVSKFEAKGLNQLLECLPANRSRSLTFDMTFLANQNINYRWTPREICKCCNEFFVPQLEGELDILKQLNYANKEWAQGLEKLLANELGDAFKNHQAFLLRVGQHGGAESNTLEGVRHIKINQGKGKSAKYLPKPTTIWLAGNHKDQQHDLLPFGWVLVEIGDVVLDKTHAFLKGQAAPDYQRHEKLQHLATQRAEFLAQEQKKHELQVQQDAEAAEQKRLKQAAEDAKAVQMAAMTEAQKAIFVLQQEYQTAKTRAPEPNGILRQLLTQTMNQASSWSQTDKQALWETGNELCAFWGKPKKLRDQLKSLQE